MLNYIIGAVGLACIAKIISQMCGQRLPKDNGIVWNDAIEKRLAVRRGRKDRTAEAEATTSELLSPSKINH